MARLAHNFRHGVPDLVKERQQVGLLAVTGDRHVRRDEVEPEGEVLILRSLGDGVGEPASEDVDVALVARGVDVTGDRRAVDADAQTHVVFFRRFGPGLDHERDFSLRLVGTKRSSPGRGGIGVAIKHFRTCRTQPLRLYLTGVLPRGLQQPRGLLLIDILADHADKARLGDDFAGAATAAAVEARDQLAHQRVAAGRQQLVKLRSVVPPGRRLARVGLSPRHHDGRRAPSTVRRHRPE